MGGLLFFRAGKVSVRPLYAVVESAFPSGVSVGTPLRALNRCQGGSTHTAPFQLLHRLELCLDQVLLPGWLPTKQVSAYCDFPNSFAITNRLGLSTIG